MTRTIERNYRKHPHTARFLMTFHAAAQGLPSDIDVPATDDLFDAAPAQEIRDRRSPAQAALMQRLIVQLGELDGRTAIEAANYTRGMTEHGRWTPGRDGNASAWISRMIAKVRELETDKAAPAPAPAVIPAGRYAIERDGEIKCYEVNHGKPGTQWAGRVFLSRISSDDRYPIRNEAEKAAILSEISADAEAARVLAAITLRQCARCGRTLSDTKNPYFSMGLGPDCGTK